jgi:hypothetical protein
MLSKMKIMVNLSTVDLQEVEINCFEELEISYAAENHPPTVILIYEFLRTVNNCKVAGFIRLRRNGHILSPCIPLVVGSFYQFQLLNSQSYIELS